MATVDTLTILLEADASGLTTKFNQAYNQVKNTVSKMNSQEVDWTSILSKSISPAIITEVAAMFANAIVQYTQFQQAAMNINSVGTQATSDFANSIGDMSGEAYTLAQSAGRSIGDTTSMFEKFSKAGLDAEAAMAATTAASGIARDTGMDLGTVTSELATLFSNWGVHTLPQVNNALDGLVNASGQGQFGFEELIQTISEGGNMLKGSTSIADTAMQLQHLTKEGNLSESAAKTMFDTFIKGFSDTTSPLNIFLGGFDSIKNKLKGSDGLIGVLQDVTDKVHAYGQNTGLAAQILGLSAEEAAIFGSATDKSMRDAAKASDEALKSMTPWQKFLKDHTTQVGQLDIEWNKLQTSFTSFVVPTAISALTEMLHDINTVIEDLSNIDMKKGALSLLSGVMKLVADESKILAPVMADMVAPGASQAFRLAAGASSNSSSSTTNNNMPITNNNTFNIQSAGSGAATTQQINSALNKSFYGTQ
jgi:hypothetical protein